jgi:ABC-type Fe3+ transport system substrate-binding protein
VLRWLPILGLLILLAAPFALRPAGEVDDRDAPAIVIVTPHNEQIRSEFGRAFEAWHERSFGSPIRVEWSTPGGTSEIRKLLVSEYTAALEDDLPPGGNADLLWGGGSYEFSLLSRPIEKEIDGETRSTTVLAPVDFDEAALAAIYGDGRIAGDPLFDAGHRWFGTALSSFGIVYNRDALRLLDLNEPGTWQDLCDPAYVGWLTMVDPGMSGSVTTAFDAILQRRGWMDGWRILRRMAANAHSFAGSSTAGPLDAAAGEAAAAVCIDFYGRYEAQRTRDAAIQAGLESKDAVGRIGYADPPGETVIDPDPIAMLTGAPNPELARRFIEFVLSVEGQSLWQFRASPEGEPDGLGPRRFELRRLPIRRELYRDHFDRFVDHVDPWTIATPVENPNGAMRSFIAPIFRGIALDQPERLREAWRAIADHPAYPTDRGPLVTAAMVDDPDLKSMLLAFDAMPVVTGPAGASYDLSNPDLLAEVKAGWLRGGWSDAGLWPSESDPTEMFRRLIRRQARADYDRVIRGEGRSG